MTRGEVLRKLLHLAAGLPAFTVRWIGAPGAALLAAAMLGFNLLLFPRLGGRGVWREAERRRGWSAAIPLFPATVLVASLLFWRRPEVVAAVWGLLAFGDGPAGLVGAATEWRPLPWNAAKSWAGSAAYWICATPAVACLLVWTSPGRYSWPLALGVAAGAAAVGAWVESLPLAADDNLGAPLAGGLATLALADTGAGWATLGPGLLGRLALGLGVSALLGWAAGRWGGLRRSGIVAGGAVGTVIWVFGGWRQFLVLGAFVAVGTGATRWAHARRAGDGSTGGAESRGARNVLANGSVAAACALLSAVHPAADAFRWAMVSAIAAACADTVAGEIGPLGRGRTRLVTTFQAVPAGTDGGVSVLGTAASLVAAGAVSAWAWLLGELPAGGALAAAAAGFAGAGLDSVLGATLERAGWLDNEAVNALATLGAALLGLAAWSMS